MLPSMFIQQVKVPRPLAMAAVGAAVLVGVLLPSAASASTDAVGITQGGSASINGSEQVTIDETTGLSPFAEANVGGGKWQYGIGGGYSYSYYYHKTAEHRSTACSRTACAKTGWADGGVTTHAKALKTASGNTAFWDKK